MKDIWAYDPDICDGDYCPMNCDICPKRELVLEKQEDDDDHIGTDHG